VHGTHLNFLLCELHARRHAIDHASHPAAVRLTEGGDAEHGAERVGARRTRCTASTPTAPTPPQRLPAAVCRRHHADKQPVAASESQWLCSLDTSLPPVAISRRLEAAAAYAGPGNAVNWQPPG
jgi:hypothetical protein